MTQHDLDLMLAGDPVEAMEAAKRLIVAETMEPVGLSRIAADKKNKSGGRVAAIYALGFLDDATVLALAVRRSRQTLDDFMTWETAAS